MIGRSAGEAQDAEALGFRETPSLGNRSKGAQCRGAESFPGLGIEAVGGQKLGTGGDLPAPPKRFVETLVHLWILCLFMDSNASTLPDRPRSWRLARI